VRNPIYVAALAVIVGQALLFGQLGPLVYAAILWAGMACRRTIKLLRGEAEKPGSIKWNKGPDRTLQLAANEQLATTR
jgi:hypothetical protein